MAITRNLRVFAKKDIFQEETQCLGDVVMDVLRYSPCERILEHYHNVVGTDDSVLHLFSCKVRNIITYFIRELYVVKLI